MAFSELYVSRIKVSNQLPENEYYAHLPMIRSLQGDGLELTKQVSFFVGENGIGKSTLVEAIAVALGFNPEGGTKNFLFSTSDTHSDLYQYIIISRGIKAPKDGFYLRAESFYNAASYLDEIGKVDARALDPYGGVSLHEQSHGESFLALVENRFSGHGIYILDEPEAALSPTRLLRLMVNMEELVKEGAQFIIATHSPILMAFPGAEVFQMGEEGMKSVPYSETEHFQLTKEFINNPERMFRYLFE